MASRAESILSLHLLLLFGDLNMSTVVDTAVVMMVMVVKTSGAGRSPGKTLG